MLKTGFNITRFAEEFKKTVNWMLANRYNQKIKKDLQDFQSKKAKLTLNPDSLDAFRLIIELIKTNSGRLNKPLTFDNEMNSFVTKHGINFRTPKAREELVRLVGEHRARNVTDLLDFPSTIEQFTKFLYQLAKERKTIVLGEKGRDNYLRDFGYWDRIPIDRHEMRFVVRSGIFHSCSTKDNSDHLENSHLQNALTVFCNQYLKGFLAEGIDLGDAPGIVDLFIWSYCAEERYNICKNTPNCRECNLNGVCLYALTNLS
jgi:thermostable 8-oxoguanine DNA glycosylase